MTPPLFVGGWGSQGSVICGELGKERGVLEGNNRDHRDQQPDHFKAKQKLVLIIKGITQIPLEHQQAWGTNLLTRKPGWFLFCLTIISCQQLFQKQKN